MRGSDLLHNPTVKNFGDNIRFRPRHRYAPRTESEVLDLLNRHADGKIRANWGKYFPLERNEVERVYPNLDEFRRVCEQIDPRGVFRNAFSERVLGL